MRKPTFTIIFQDSVFTNVTITEIEDAWILSYTTVEGESDPAEYYEIRYKLVCQDEEWDELSVIGSAKICIKNLCQGVNCNEGEQCNPCTGECELADINLGLNIQ